MKTTAIFTSAFAAAAGLLMAGGIAKAEVTLRYAHVGVEGEPQTRYAAEFAKLVGERTAGRVKITVFPNSQLGNLSEMVDGTKMGTIQMAHHDFASLGKILNDMSVFNAPYIYRDAAHAVKATQPSTSDVLQELNKQLIEKGGLRVLGSCYRGARQLSANFPVYSPEDVKGKKIRAVPLKLWISMITGMGAIPTPVEITELPTALATGLVVGQENPLSNIYAQKFHEVQSHIMMTAHMQSVLSVWVNEKAWQKIPEADRKIIESVAVDMAATSLAWEQKSEAEIKEKIKAAGTKFIEEKDGLKNDEFRKVVLKQVNQDFPEWTGYIERLLAIK